MNSIVDMTLKLKKGKIMKNKKEKNEIIFNIFNKYIELNNINNTDYARAYADMIGVSFHYRCDLRNFKRGVDIPLSHVVVFCSFLNESQKNEFLGELFNV